MKFLILIMLVGCAADSYILKQKELLPYKESSQVTKVNMNSYSVTVNSVADLRSKNEIGYAYTGVEYKKTPVFMAGQTSLVIKDYLESALRSRNIPVVPNGDVLLEVNILDLMVHEVIQKNEPEKARCLLTLEFNGQRDKTQWNGKFTTEYTSAGDMSDATERLGPTLASCMNDLVEKLVNDEKFLEVLTRKDLNE